jgi:putative copper export protein
MLRVVLLLLVPGVLGAVAGVVATGAAAAPAFADPGPGVRWSLPLARLVGDLAGSLALGLLIAASALPPPGENGRPSQRAVPAALHGACAAGVVWTLASLARLVLGYAAGTGQPLGDPSLGTQLESYVTQVDEGRWAAAAAAGAAVVATLAAGITRRRTAVGLAVLVVAMLGAQALSGAAAAPGRTAAGTVLLWLHAAGAAVAVGGIGALLLLAPGSGADFPALAARLARPAAAVLALVGVSGLAAAGWDLSTRPGTPAIWALVAVKTVVLAALGVLIWRAARDLAVRRLPGGLRPVAAALPAAAVAVGIGVAVASAR